MPSAGFPTRDPCSQSAAVLYHRNQLLGYLRGYMIRLLTAIGLSPGGRSAVHIYTQTVHRTIFTLISTKWMRTKKKVPFKDEAQTALFKDPVRTAL